jgi:hypothetical protein
MPGFLKRTLPTIATSIVVGLLAGGISLAVASLTFSGTTIISGSGVSIDASGTISIGTSTATGIVIGNTNSTVSFNGNVGIGGGLTLVGDLGIGSTGGNYPVDVGGDIRLTGNLLLSESKGITSEFANKQLMFSSDYLPLINEPTNPVLTPPSGEMSSIVEGTTMYLWYAGGSSWTDLYYTYSTDSSFKTYATPTKVLSNIRFPYVIEVNGIYYLFANKSTIGNGIHMWSSPDRVTWTEMNNGNPVFTQVAGTVCSTVFNPGVVVIGSTWYMFVECSPINDGYHSGLVYSYSTLADLNWDTHKTATQIFSGMGGPNPIYVPDRNAILLLGGQLNNQNNSLLDVKAIYANLGDNLALAASWHPASYFEITYPNMSTADPDLVVMGAGKDHSLLIHYFYNQISTYQAYSDLTLDQFYDAVTSGGNYLSVSNSYPSVSPTISALGADTNIGINLAPQGTGSVNIVNGGGLTLVDGTAHTPGGLLTEGNSYLIDFGMNEGSGNRFGTYVQANQGGMLTIDTRSGHPVFNFQVRAAGNAGNGYETNAMAILGSGNVGIGTTGPTLKLDVEGSTGLPVAIGGGAQTNGVARFGTGGTNPILDFGGDVNSPYEFWMQAHSPNNAVAFPLSLNPNGGNVGIGTITPGASLDINGTSTILEQSNTPPSSTSTCTTGMEGWDANYEYRCVATNTWKRAALSSF